MSVESETIFPGWRENFHNEFDIWIDDTDTIPISQFTTMSVSLLSGKTNVNSLKDSCPKRFLSIEFYGSICPSGRFSDSNYCSGNIFTDTVKNIYYKQN